MAAKRRKTRAAPARGSRARANWLVWAGGAALIGVVAVVAYMAFAGGGDDGQSVRRGSVRRPTPVVITDLLTTVKVEDTDFSPPALRIPVGGTVRWEFEDSIPHDVTEDRGLFASDRLREGASFEYTFDEPGEFFYYCTLHHKMQATVIVGDTAPTGITR
jgi:plastocyanin